MSLKTTLSSLLLVPTNMGGSDMRAFAFFVLIFGVSCSGETPQDTPKNSRDCRNKGLECGSGFECLKNAKGAYECTKKKAVSKAVTKTANTPIPPPPPKLKPRSTSQPSKSTKTATGKKTLNPKFFGTWTLDLDATSQRDKKFAKLRSTSGGKMSGELVMTPERFEFKIKIGSGTNTVAGRYDVLKSGGISSKLMLYTDDGRKTKTTIGFLGGILLVKQAKSRFYFVRKLKPGSISQRSKSAGPATGKKTLKSKFFGTRTLDLDATSKNDEKFAKLRSTAGGKISGELTLTPQRFEFKIKIGSGTNTVAGRYDVLKSSYISATLMLYADNGRKTKTLVGFLDGMFVVRQGKSLFFFKREPK